jgi:hypothetical protein
MQLQMVQLQELSLLSSTMGVRCQTSHAHYYLYVQLETSMDGVRSYLS